MASPGKRRIRGSRMNAETTSKQLLHIVFGGELKDLDGVEFRDPKAIDIVGIFPSYAEAYAAWKGAANARSTTPPPATSSSTSTAFSSPTSRSGGSWPPPFCGGSSHVS